MKYAFAIAFLFACAPKVTTVVGPGATATDADGVRQKITSPDGCSTISAEEWEMVKRDAEPDYFYFKGYCFGDSNPEMACSLYAQFITAAPGDTRVGKAKSYIAAQDTKAYPTCALP